MLVWSAAGHTDGPTSTASDTDGPTVPWTVGLRGGGVLLTFSRGPGQMYGLTELMLPTVPIAGELTQCWARKRISSDSLI